MLYSECWIFLHNMLFIFVQFVLKGFYQLFINCESLLHFIWLVPTHYLLHFLLHFFKFLLLIIHECVNYLVLIKNNLNLFALNTVRGKPINLLFKLTFCTFIEDQFDFFFFHDDVLAILLERIVYFLINGFQAFDKDALVAFIYFDIHKFNKILNFRLLVFKLLENWEQVIVWSWIQLK